MSEPLLHVTDTTRWIYTTTKENFAKIKGHEKFWRLATLGRALNTLRFVQMPLAYHEGEDTPAAIRARFNSLYFSCAIFCECVQVVQVMGKHFKHMPEFTKLADVAIKQHAQKLLTSGLTTLRNKLVFHFEPEAIGEQLQTFDPQKPIFIAGLGNTNEQVYYELSDDCTLKALSASNLFDLDALIQEITEVVEEFTVQAEIFMIAALTEYGWHGEPVL